MDKKMQCKIVGHRLNLKYYANQLSNRQETQYNAKWFNINCLFRIEKKYIYSKWPAKYISGGAPIPIYR